jgi:hypothetical protein
MAANDFKNAEKSDDASHALRIVNNGLRNQ